MSEFQLPDALRDRDNSDEFRLPDALAEYHVRKVIKGER